MEPDQIRHEQALPRSQQRQQRPTPPDALSPPASTVADTWNWLWKDTVTRIAPLTGAALLYAAISHKGPSGIGITVRRWPHEVALGLGVGLPLAALAGAFRAWTAPRYRLPTRADQALQSTYYLAINAPAEEVFWRGAVQSLMADVVARLTGRHTLGRATGWALATAGYASYHRLGGWSWTSIAGVAFAGSIFGALFARDQRQPSLIAPVIAHGVATAAFLSWGDVMLHRRAVRLAHAKARLSKASGAEG